MNLAAAESVSTYPSHHYMLPLLGLQKFTIRELACILKSFLISDSLAVVRTQIRPKIFSAPILLGTQPHVLSLSHTMPVATRSSVNTCHLPLVMGR